MVTSSAHVQNSSEERTSPTSKDTSICVIDYSAKSIAVFGNTYAIKDHLAKLGGKWNRGLKNPNGLKKGGWIFVKSKKSEVESLLTSQHLPAITKTAVKKRSNYVFKTGRMSGMALHNFVTNTIAELNVALLEEEEKEGDRLWPDDPLFNALNVKESYILISSLLPLWNKNNPPDEDVTFYGISSADDLIRFMKQVYDDKRVDYANPFGADNIDRFIWDFSKLKK